MPLKIYLDKISMKHYTKKLFLNRLKVLTVLSSLMLMYNNCGGGFDTSNISSIQNGGAGSLQSNFQCSNRSETSDSGTHFLSKKQLSNTVIDLFGNQIYQDISVSLSTLTDESFDEDTHLRLSSISNNKVQAYFNIANEIAQSVTSNNTRKQVIFGNCSTASTLTVSCLDQYLTGFAEKILRRPLTTNEINFSRNIINGSGTTNEKLRAVLAYQLQSPYFIWRVELGSSSNSSADLNLTAYETASRLSFQLTDSTPDDQLLLAAKNNQLLSDSQLKAQALRLIQTRRGKDKLIETLLHWSLSDRTSDLTNLPAGLTSGVNMNGLGTAMIDEAKKYIEYIVFNQNGTFSDILNSKASFASHTGLAKVYNHTPSNGVTPVQVPGRRKGLLMKAPFLTWTGSRTNIIKRGVEFQKRVLCNTIPQPTVDIADDRNQNVRTPAEALMHSNRDNVAEQTKSPVCMGCHSTINPTGFAFEEFDSLGRFRSDEAIFDMADTFYQSVPVDTLAYVPLPGNGTKLVNDVHDLVDYIGSSSVGNECFIRNAHRFYNEKTEVSNDNCHLSGVFNDLANNKKTIVEVIVALTINKNIKTKRSL